MPALAPAVRRQQPELQRHGVDEQRRDEEAREAETDRRGDSNPVVDSRARAQARQSTGRDPRRLRTRTRAPRAASTVAHARGMMSFTLDREDPPQRPVEPPACGANRTTPSPPVSSVRRAAQAAPSRTAADSGSRRPPLSASRSRLSASRTSSARARSRVVSGVAERRAPISTSTAWSAAGRRALRVRSRCRAC